MFQNKIIKMIIWFVTLLLFSCFRVWAKTQERKAADALTKTIYKENKKEAILLASQLIPRPSAGNTIKEEVINSLPLISLITKTIYSLFAFSLTVTDVRTPNSFILWDNEKQFYELRDPDVAESYRTWHEAFFWDGLSAGLLTLVIFSIFSKEAFSFLFN